jgi:hypothetical protein
VRSRVLVFVAFLAIVGAGCSSSPSGSSTTPTTERPLPAGPHPSEISKMVCADEARSDIASALGEKAAVSEPTWQDHLYSCRYTYPTGSFVLSVKELSSWAQTYAYFRMLGTELASTRTLQGLGQGAFQTTDGSVVVRKDWKVLVVDSSGLPAQFGLPPTSSGDVAVTVADVILGCWAGD